MLIDGPLEPSGGRDSASSAPGPEFYGLPAEERLLISLARPSLDPAARGEARGILNQGPDWGRLLTLAQKVFALPLVAYHLEQQNWLDSVPAGARRILERSRRSRLLWFLRVRAQITRVLQALAHAGVAAMPLKGAWAARVLYEDPALRPMGDVDLCIRPRDKARAKEVLGGLGYVQEPDSVLHAFSVQRPRDELRKHLPRFVQPGRLPVELHLHPFFRTPPDGGALDRVWNAARPARLWGADCLFPDPAHGLLMLCLHLHDHFFLAEVNMALYWPADIHALIHGFSREISWRELVGLAGELEAGTKVGLILDLLCRNWGTPVPRGVLKGLKRGKSLDAKNLFDWRDHPLAPWRGFLGLVRSQGSVLGSGAFLFRLVFPSEPYLQARYKIRSRAALLGWRAAHPVALAGRQARRLARSLAVRIKS